MSLQDDLLRYAQLLDKAPSTLVNDILEDAFAAVRADEPGRALVVLDAVRQALGKDAHRRLSEEYHRVLFGTRPTTQERTLPGQSRC